MLSWFKKSSSDVEAPKQSNSDTLYEGTYVSADDLIALQRYVNTINLSRISVRTGKQAGAHTSRFRGRGMDYQESRNYQAGDDIRHIDWRVTARTGKPHTKIYQEERERPLVLLVDLGASMFFGSRKVLKSVMAAKVAALLAWAGAKKGDRIGALLINGDHKEIPPKLGKHGVLGLIRELTLFSEHARTVSNFSPTHLNDELVRLRRLAKPGSLIVLLSDFYAIDETTEQHLLRLRQHNDVIAIQIIDPLELNVPVAGQYAVTDGQQVSKMDLRTRQARDSYQQFFQQHHQSLEQLMHKQQIPLLSVSTEDDVATALQSYFGLKVQSPQLVVNNE